jgi:hypothetical protein
MRRFGWLLTVLVPAVLGAQRVRGIVVDSALNSPVSGVVVSVLDSANRVGARTITDGQGRFSLAVPASGPKLRFMRIGYRLRDVPLGAARDGEIRFAMERVPPILERVQVSDKELCPGSDDRGAAFQLWEQARTGLLATIVAREAKPANAVTVVFERMMSPSDEIVRKQTKRINRGRTTRPFVASNEPDVFARRGYMTEDVRGRVFHAPDADVLLHESFALTHCFRLRASDGAHRGQIGVAFAPAPVRGRDTVVDVSGVIWMDAASPQLRTLDFLYTALEPPAMSARAGGHIEFRTMPNGVAFIERWVLRLPSLTLVETNLPGSSNITRSSVRTLRAERTDTRLAQIGESGGVVISAQWDDGTVWQDTPSIVAGIVSGRRTNTPVTDAIVFLEGTDDSTTTDVNGEFDLATIPGRYTLRVTDTVFKEFSKERTASQLVTVPRATIEIVRVEMAPIGDALEGLCRGPRPAPGSLFVAGYLTTTDGSPLRDVHVRASWTDGAVDRTPSRVLVPTSREIAVDDDGRFVVCGAPPLRPFHVELLKGKTTIADTTVAIMTVASTHRLMWAVAPPGTPRAAVSQAAAVEPPGDSIPASAMSPAEKQRTFQAHAATRLGAYLSDSALATVRGRPLVDVLPGLVKTLRVWRTAGQAFVVAPSRTTEIPGFQNLSRCISDVYVDGVAHYGFAQQGRVMPPNLATYSTDTIGAVEYYAADTRVPDGLRASPCGVLVLWRK